MNPQELDPQQQSLLRQYGLMSPEQQTAISHLIGQLADANQASLAAPDQARDTFQNTQHR